MAVTTTPRLGVTRWSAGTDPFSRAQMDASHAQLEALAAVYGQGTLAARPAAGVVGRTYTVRGDTVANNGRQFYDDGTTWFEVGINGQNVAARAGAAGSVAHTVHGFTGQTANLSEWKSSTGAVVGRVAVDGSITFGPASLAATTVTTLTASGAAVLQSTLAVTGVATFTGALTVNNTLKATQIRSTATRSGSSLPKTELNDDGTGRFDALIPPGFFMCSLRADTPAGWLRMEGQTVNVATYPDLWEALGSPGGGGATTFVIPDWRDRTTVGVSGTKELMSTGGSATATLTVNHLPAHTHDIAHTHDFAHTHTIAHTHDFAHTHTINHDHASFTSGSENADHAHYVSLGGGGHEHNYTAQHNAPANAASGSSALYTQRITATTSGGGGHSHEGWSGGINVNHQHAIDVPSFSGTSGGASTTTTGASSAANSGAASTTTTSAPSAANSGSTGSGTAFSTQNPYGAGYWVIKT